MNSFSLLCLWAHWTTSYTADKQPNTERNAIVVKRGVSNRTYRCSNCSNLTTNLIASTARFTVLFLYIQNSVTGSCALPIGKLFADNNSVNGRNSLMAIPRAQDTRDYHNLSRHSFPCLSQWVLRSYGFVLCFIRSQTGKWWKSPIIGERFSCTHQPCWALLGTELAAEGKLQGEARSNPFEPSVKVSMSSLTDKKRSEKSTREKCTNSNGNWKCKQSAKLFRKFDCFSTGKTTF